MEVVITESISDGAHPDHHGTPVGATETDQLANIGGHDLAQTSLRRICPIAQLIPAWRPGEPEPGLRRSCQHRGSTAASRRSGVPHHLQYPLSERF
jgi:hypothetical protein